MIAMRKIGLLVIAALWLGSASLAGAAGFGAGLRVSSLGVGLEGAAGVMPDLNVRGGIYGFQYSYSGTESGNEYEFDLELFSAAGLVDYHLLGGGFRVSGGVLFNGNGIDAVGETALGTTYEIGGEVYTIDEVGEFTGDVEFSSLAPYAGIGWGNMASGKPGLGLLLDLGVVFQGSPSVALGTEKVLDDARAQEELEANLAAEEADMEDGLKEFKFYPVLSVGVRYTF